MKRPLLSLSLLNLDLRCLERSIRKYEQMPIDSFHMDIMDGHFVDNISFGPLLVETVRRLTDKPIISHLMIEKPEKYAESFISAGSDALIIHLETIDEKNVSLFDKEQIGISINPDIETQYLKSYLNKVNRVLLMSVMAGFGGQKFIEATIERIKKVFNMRTELNLDFIISVDGGINSDTGPRCQAAGADELSVGSYITRADDPSKAVSLLKS